MSLENRPPSRESLVGLAALGFLSALWSVVLWAELWIARLTGTATCAFGDTSCGALWDSRFARVIHDVSSVPVAGWGLAWGLAAAALPLLRLARGDEHRWNPELRTAIRLVAAAGAVSVAVLALVSAALGTLCTGCAVVYVLVGGYAGIALGGWPAAGWTALPRAAAWAAGSAAVALVALIPIGRATPDTLAAAGQAQIGAATRGGGDDLSRMLPVLNPQQAQLVADSLGLLRRSPVRPVPAPRALAGAADAPVKIVTWSDVRCPHCADLHQTLRLLLETYPGRLSVDSRFFPLDGACNAAVGRSGDPARCLAAQAAVCAEGRTDVKAFTGELFARGETLDEAGVRDLVASKLGADGTACLAAPATLERVRADAAAALPFELDGTPLVVVNGRVGTSFPPFLEAMVLAGGNPDHPAFAALPQPNLDAHMH